MQISQSGIDAIKRHEGLRLFAYLDSAGIPTIGFGRAHGVSLNQHITSETAETYLREDLQTVEKCIADSVKVPLNQNQYDALCSLIFNIGVGAFKDSTLLRLLNAGAYQEAAEQFARWDKARVNGVLEPLAGLTSRRRAEQSLFMDGIDTSPPLVHLGPEIVQEPPNPERGDTMPIPAIVGALLPSVIELIPRLASIFKPGSPVAERNVAAASTVLDIVTTATKAVNAQEAVEKMKADPALVVEATKAVEAQWFSLVEGGGGGIAAARKSDADYMNSDGPWWQVIKSPSFVIACMLLPLVYLIVGNVAGLYGAEWSSDARAGIAGSIAGGIVMGLIGYYYGQTTTKNRTPVP